MIDIQHLSFRYSIARPEVFSDFSLSLDGGKVVGLLGKNGTGKSTLLYLLSGLLHPTRGNMLFNGIATRERRPETLSETFIVPEEFELPAMTMERYVSIKQPFYPRFNHELLRQNLEAFELPADVDLGQLSMGQKKKAYMSFALAAGTRLLLLDEPTNGLDIPSKAQFRKVVSQSMTPERTIIISTHQVRDVEMLVDHVIMLDGTCLLANNSTHDIRRRLVFEHRPAGAELSDALYVEPTTGGSSVVTRNLTEMADESTPIDLELLFNALLHDPSLMK